MVRVALLEQERLLIEKIRFLGDASNRYRLKVESELAVVRRRLERLASQIGRNDPRTPDRTRPELPKDSPAKGTPVPTVCRVPEREIKKKPQAPPRPLLGRFYDRLVSMCVVETTAVSYSGMRSWKTEPCRVLLRLLAKPVVPATPMDLDSSPASAPPRFPVS
jgi:hypothetical protein